ncbi:MAG: hypothetical protein DRI94_12270 [Bacteroidetes bacterium]|nr:MAG: hypothetical protein DRI94_12270 [Bacteroidota bacterium]
MKKLLLLPLIILLFLIIGNNVYSQETSNIFKPFEFDGIKVYPDGNSIAYFYLEGIEKPDVEEFLQYKMINLPEVIRFIIYKKQNG